MDSITVYDENGKLLYSLYGCSIMGGENERWYLIKDRFKILPKLINIAYTIWSKNSNYDGDNEKMTIVLNGIKYVFINHYWD